MGLTLAKYEAVGNDFLVLIDPARAVPVDGELARRVCERRRGVGADGLLRVSAEGDGLAMELFNADGGPAETSGNGLRCAVLAAIHAGLVEPAASSVRVRTGAGPVEATIISADELSGEIEVEMGELELAEADELPLPDRRAISVDVGNPHLVLIAEAQRAAPVELAELGPKLEASRPAGVNVEVVDVLDPGHCRLEVWERGAGLTLACGSGSCASAAAGRALGLLGDEVEVANPGGVLQVRLSGPLFRPVARLRGPARRVASIVVPR